MRGGGGARMFKIPYGWSVEPGWRAKVLKRKEITGDTPLLSYYELKKCGKIIKMCKQWLSLRQTWYWRPSAYKTLLKKMKFRQTYSNKSAEEERVVRWFDSHIQSTTDNSDFVEKVNKSEQIEFPKKKTLSRKQKLILFPLWSLWGWNKLLHAFALTCKQVRLNLCLVWRDRCTLTKEPRRLELNLHVTAPEHTVYCHPSQRRCFVVANLL